MAEHPNRMKNIIFDFGNVLVRWEPEKIYTEYFGDESKAWWFFRHVTDADWRNRIDAGENTAKCVNELQSVFPDYSEAIALYDSRYFDMLTGEIPGMYQLLSDLIAEGRQV